MCNRIVRRSKSFACRRFGISRNARHGSECREYTCAACCRRKVTQRTTRRYKDARIRPQLTILSLWTRRRSFCRPTAWLRPRFLPGLPGLSAHKLVQYWSRTPADRPTFSPRRLLVSLPHHGEWWEPARAVRRGAAPGGGSPGASSPHVKVETRVYFETAQLRGNCADLSPVSCTRQFSIHFWGANIQLEGSQEQNSPLAMPWKSLVYLP